MIEKTIPYEKVLKKLGRLIQERWESQGDKIADLNI
jgi:hypothetical protein